MSATPPAEHGPRTRELPPALPAGAPGARGSGRRTVGRRHRWAIVVAVAAGVAVALAGCGGQAAEPEPDGAAAVSAAIDAPDEATLGDSLAVHGPDPVGEPADPGAGPPVVAAPAGAEDGAANDETGNPVAPASPATGGATADGGARSGTIPPTGPGLTTKPMVPTGESSSVDASGERPPTSTSTSAPAPPDTALDAEVAQLEAEVEAFGGEATAVGQQLP